MSTSASETSTKSGEILVFWGCGPDRFGAVADRPAVGRAGGAGEGDLDLEEEEEEEPEPDLEEELELVLRLEEKDSLEEVEWDLFLLEGGDLAVDLVEMRSFFGDVTTW